MATTDVPIVSVVCNTPALISRFLIALGGKKPLRGEVRASQIDISLREPCQNVPSYSPVSDSQAAPMVNMFRFLSLATLLHRSHCKTHGVFC